MKGLRVDGLTVEIRLGSRVLTPVDGVSFSVAENECVALLGESGCGKSLTALALMRLLPDGGRVAAGEAVLDGSPLFDLPERDMRRVRGGGLAMVFQEPMTSLNPVMTLGRQVEESLALHQGLKGTAARAEADRLLAAVGLPERAGAGYPFQLSGGQRQRALIAMMLAGRPSVLIADEPTTALDVTVQAQILGLLAELRRERGMGLLLITHDLDVARDMADRVAVMYAGQIVEWADREALYQRPFHPYTRRLFEVLPSAARRGDRLAHLPGQVPAPDARLPGCRFADRCPHVFERCRIEAPALRELTAGHWVRCHLEERIANPAPASAPPAPPADSRPVLEVSDLAVHFPVRRGLLRRVDHHVKAVDGVSLTLRRGETLALVGESGCGKTTLARAILRLLEPSRGQVKLAGEDITRLKGEALRRKRAAMQIVFQDPFASLDPRMRIGDTLEEGLAALRPELGSAARHDAVRRLLAQVGLPEDAAGRYPHAFSGGQRQRIAIARALAVEPRLLICDEPTSALDVSVQAQILNLLADLQRQQGLAYLFITHNLPVVGYLAHRVAVMYQGRIVEEGPAEQLMTHPTHPYTRLLLASAPGQGLVGAVTMSTAVTGVSEPSGCPYATHCPEADAHCRVSAPEEKILQEGWRVACHRAGNST